MKSRFYDGLAKVHAINEMARMSFINFVFDKDGNRTLDFNNQEEIVMPFDSFVEMTQSFNEIIKQVKEQQEKVVGNKQETEKGQE